MKQVSQSDVCATAIANDSLTKSAAVGPSPPQIQVVDDFWSSPSIMARCVLSWVSSHILSTWLVKAPMTGRTYHGAIAGNLEKTSLLTRMGWRRESTVSGGRTTRTMRRRASAFAWTCHERPLRVIRKVLRRETSCQVVCLEHSDT